MNDKPLVSTITPTFNSAKYLEECLESVLRQDYPNTEHVLVDGCSTDGTLDILRKYHKKYPERVYYISEKDKGACDAVTKGLKMAKGTIFGFLGSDDTYPLGAIAKVIKAFKKYPEAGLVYGNCNVINGQGQFTHTAYAQDFDLEESIHTFCRMFTPAIFYKKEVVDKIGYMDGSINACDYDFVLRAGKFFKFQRIDESLANFRMHKDSVTCSKTAVYMYAWQNFKVAHRYGATLYGARARNLVVTFLTQPFRPILAPIYHNRILYPTLKILLHKVIGGRPEPDRRPELK